MLEEWMLLIAEFFALPDSMAVYQAAASLATIVAAIVGGFALGIAWVQVQNGRRLRREGTAYGWYHDLEVRCFDYPVLANPELGTFDFSAKTLDGDPVLYEKYTWFVSLMLNAGEAILQIRPTQDWRNSVAEQIEIHARYLAHRRGSPNDIIDKCYTPGFVRLVDEVLAGVAARATNVAATVPAAAAEPADSKQVAVANV